MRAVYFSVSGKIIFDKTMMGLNVLGIRNKNTRNDSKSKSNSVTAQHIVFTTKSNKNEF